MYIAVVWCIHLLTPLSKGNKGPIQLFSCGAALFGVKNVTGKKKKEPIRPPSIYLKKAVLINGKQKQNTKKKSTKSYSEYLWTSHGICWALTFCRFLETIALSQSGRNAKILTNYLWDNQLSCTIYLRLDITKCLLVEQAGQWSNSLWNTAKPSSWTEKHP